MDLRGWIFSGVLHAGVIAAAVLGLPSLFESDAEIVEDAIVVAMVAEEEVVGGEFVKSYGGDVFLAKLMPGTSTSKTIGKIRS